MLEEVIGKCNMGRKGLIWFPVLTQWGHRDVPIKDPAEIPEGWTSCDLDIAEE
jgi:hypothetical protein